MKNRILSVLLALILLFTAAVNASASAAIPDQNEKGSLTFVMNFAGMPLTEGNINICKVADIVKAQGGGYEFRLIEQLQELELDLTDLTDQELAEELLRAVKEKGLPKLTAPIENGKAVFEDLEMGLYLVWQDETDTADGFMPIQPFLISVPRWQDDAYVMDILSAPKVPIEPKPS